MVRKYIILLGLILLFASTVPVFGQSDTNKGDKSGSQNSNLSQSELSSSTGGPFSVTAYASFKGFLGDCVKDTACSTSASITWYGSVPSGNAATTLTVIFSSTAPGPLQLYIGTSKPVQSSSLWVTVDNSNPVYAAGLFPPPAAGQSVYLQSYGYWSPPSDTAYPWLQWAPTSVTLVYQ